MPEPDSSRSDSSGSDRSGAASTELDPAEIRRIQLAVIQLARQLRWDGREGLSRSALSALAVVAKFGPLRPGELAAREGVDPASISRTLRALFDAGLARRGRDGNDGRATLVELTEAGQQRFEQMREDTTRFLLDSLVALTDDERAALPGVALGLEGLVRVTSPNLGAAATSDSADAMDGRV